MKSFLTRQFFTIVFLSFLMLYSSCSLFRAGDKSYSQLTESMEGIDTRPLEGKIIVLDPGHGGPAPGAVGTGGLTEKQVNLNVALRLQSYLENAGAKVVMTRSVDTGMIADRIDSLRGDDLDFRVRMSENEEADLFISLHHNSNLPLNREYSAIETYYKMEDYFASKDAARMIHKHLVRNLQIPLNFLRPGNYYVLRNNTRTAILGEASYISNPSLEKKLSNTESIEIEASSYFLGILDYFSRGVPRITGVTPADGEVVYTDMPVFKISVLEDEFGDGIDEQSILIGIDDEEIPYTYSSSLITATPSKPLSSGEHNLFVNVVNIKGNHSLLFESRFNVDIPPSHIVVTHSPGSVPPDRITPLTISATVIDKNNAAVKDSTSVHIKFEDDSGSEEINYTKDGVVRFYFSYFKEATIPYTIRSGDVSYRGALVIENRDKPLLLLTFTKKGTPNERLRNVLVGLNGRQFGYTNNDGNIVFENLEQGEYTISANLPGYYPANLQRRVFDNSSHLESVNLEPMYSSILFRKRILIDPEFGGLTSGSVGPSGLRAADENMETARYLVNLLKAAGADSRLTINPGEDLTPYSRVRLSNEFDAQLFVSIRHSSSTNQKNEGLATYAYPTSTNGKRLGSLVLNSMTDVMNSRGAGPIEAADYVLQQTGCPAVIINLGNVSNPEIEEELYASRRNRLEAYTVFTALLKYYAGASRDWGGFSGQIVDSDGKPVGNAVVSLDKTIVIQSDNEGRFKFIALENREYAVSIQAKGYRLLNETFVISKNDRLERNFTLVKIK